MWCLLGSTRTAFTASVSGKRHQTVILTSLMTLMPDLHSFLSRHYTLYTCFIMVIVITKQWLFTPDKGLNATVQWNAGWMWCDFYWEWKKSLFFYFLVSLESKFHSLKKVFWRRAQMTAGINLIFWWSSMRVASWDFKTALSHLAIYNECECPQWMYRQRAFLWGLSGGSTFN